MKALLVEFGFTLPNSVMVSYLSTAWDVIQMGCFEERDVLDTHAFTWASNGDARVPLVTF